MSQLKLKSPVAEGAKGLWPPSRAPTDKARQTPASDEDAEVAADGGPTDWAIDRPLAVLVQRATARAAQAEAGARV